VTFRSSKTTATCAGVRSACVRIRRSGGVPGHQELLALVDREQGDVGKRYLAGQGLPQQLHELPLHGANVRGGEDDRIEDPARLRPIRGDEQHQLRAGGRRLAFQIVGDGHGHGKDWLTATLQQRSKLREPCDGVTGIRDAAPHLAQLSLSCLKGVGDGRQRVQHDSERHLGGEDRLQSIKLAAHGCVAETEITLVGAAQSPDERREDGRHEIRWTCGGVPCQQGGQDLG
jgi:hypothetical protein